MDQIKPQAKDIRKDKGFEEQKAEKDEENENLAPEIPPKIVLIWKRSLGNKCVTTCAALSLPANFNFARDGPGCRNLAPTLWPKSEVMSIEVDNHFSPCTVGFT